MVIAAPLRRRALNSSSLMLLVSSTPPPTSGPLTSSSVSSSKSITNPSKTKLTSITADGNEWTLTIPESLAPGNYVLRHEIIALHSAGQENGAQAYPQCVNIEVTGSGSTDPCADGADCVAGTALYKAADAGIKYDIYGGDISSYPIPGPKAWAGAAAKVKRTIARAFFA
jgi:hypothetical protein